MATSAPVKPLTGSLNTAVKLIGAALVGSAWPAAWLIVTVGGVVSIVTVLSVGVEAVWRLPTACSAAAGAWEALPAAPVFQAPEADGDGVGALPMVSPSTAT